MKTLTSIALGFALVSCSSAMAQTKNATSEPKTADASQLSKQTQEPADTTASSLPGLKQPPNDGSSGTEDPTIAGQKNYDNAIVLYNSGKYEEAIAALKEATRLRTDDPESHYLLGMAYMQSKAYKDAADSFRRAVRFKPEWPEANFRFGIMSYVLGRRSQSTEAYKKLLELDSPLANTLYRIISTETDPAAVAESVVAESESAIASVPQRAAIQPTTTQPTEERVSAPATAETTSNASSTSVPTSAPPVATDESALITTYRIGVGDVLDVRLLNSRSNRSSLYTVLDGGIIDLPLAGGAIPVAGFSTDEVQARIAEELKRRAVEDQAQVSVGIRQYASHTIIVSGLVGNGGTKVLRREAVPLYVILAEVQPRLDAARVLVMRTGKAETFDLNDPASLNFIVRPGDIINVTSRPQEFYYIAGRINFPGQKNFQPGITVLQAILAAGGTADGAKSVELSREGEGGLLMTTKINLREIKSGKAQDVKLQPGDRIEVLN
jgi:protein involved in polysaccharide export with SLBB domain